MSELKTKQTDFDVNAFIGSIENKARQDDTRNVVELMQKITGEKPILWGPSIIGFGKYHYKYTSGREGDWFLTGLSPRKQALTVYLMCGLDEDLPEIQKLGKFKIGKSCLYIRSIKDVDLNVLEKLIAYSVDRLKRKHPSDSI